MFRRNVRHTGTLPKAVGVQAVGGKESALKVQEVAGAGAGDPGVQVEMGWPRLVGGGQVELTIFGEAGRNYRIEISSDLINWSVLTEGVMREAMMQLIDSPPADANLRFYRLTSH
jgi:hypothetical protein